MMIRMEKPPMVQPPEHPESPDPPEPPHGFPARLRLRKAADFALAYESRMLKSAGPLRVYGRVNGGLESRLGLSVSRRVGGSVVRTKIKRYLREAFRLMRGELPPGLDLVVVVKPHETGKLKDYQGWLAEAAEQIDRLARRRRGPSTPGKTPEPPAPESPNSSAPPSSKEPPCAGD